VTEARLNRVDRKAQRVRAVTPASSPEAEAVAAGLAVAHGWWRRHRARLGVIAGILGVVYAAVRVGDEVVGAVGVIDGLGYKLMSESEGPYYYGAPPEVLAALSPSDDPWACKWRLKCAEPLLNPGAA
jgi:hypothetical protein